MVRTGAEGRAREGPAEIGSGRANGGRTGIVTETLFDWRCFYERLVALSALDTQPADAGSDLVERVG
jgi:hypothetical protein